MPACYLEALTVLLGVALLLAEAFSDGKNKAWLGLTAAAGLTAILILTFFAIGPETAGTEKKWAAAPLWNFYQFDSAARFFKVFFLATTIFVLLLAVDYRKVLSRFTENPGSENGTGEFYCLPVFACAGMMWVASARDLAGAFVALELVTITFYILVAYMRRNVGSLEAGVKYLIIGALSTGFLVYGIAWIYGSAGTMSLAALPGRIAQLPQHTGLLFGLALLLIGLGFKIGAVPAQIWIPDVYQGAPTPTTAFLSVASKAAGFILLMRVLEPFLAASATREKTLLVLSILAGATLLFGNLAALAQANFKRLLGYSSIAHAGFLILALASGTADSFRAVSFYLATYLIMTLGVFFILAQIRIHRDGEAVSDFNGLGKTNPILAVSLTILLAALAGVPLTAGFIGKFLVFSAAVSAGLWIPVTIAFIAAAAGFYYYFNVIRAMWWNDTAAPAVPLPIITKTSVAFFTIATIVLGFWPQPIFWMLR